ncbi:MAG: hypothetical protein CM1200mP28_08950 [Deltaproteobacteria bacterium]|nr:MAG: hypothetical protein CM1200mP28_08950 [Deltaproteobacteria bacterium]
MADHVIELGPGGGQYGGELVCDGPPSICGKTDFDGKVFETNIF